MKKFEISPTDENIVKSLWKDPLNRNRKIRKFIEMLDVVDGGTTIAINGDWGSGKTFFTKQCSLIIDNICKNKTNDELNFFIEQDKRMFKDFKISSNMKTIYYNAWANDYHSDPLLSLIYHIIKENEKQKNKDDLKELSLKTKSIITDITKEVGFNLGINVTAGFTYKTESTDLLDTVNSEEEVTEFVKKVLSKIIEKDQKLIIFVDEVDRCNPKFGVNILERIKHFFIDEKVIFVFSINDDQLEHTISKYYGSKFDGHRYLHKFFDFQFELKDINTSQYIDYLDIVSEDWNKLNLIKELAEILRFTPRDCNKYLSYIELIKLNETYDRSFIEGKGMLFVDTIIVPTLLAIKIKYNRKYKDILSGDAEYLSSILVGNSFIANWVTDWLTNGTPNDTFILEVVLKDICRTLFSTLALNEHRKQGFLINKNTRAHMLDVLEIFNYIE